ncbi:MAG: hypothetical protein WBP64_15535 [Nitrososphaeraceae archaeon]
MEEEQNNNRERLTNVIQTLESISNNNNNEISRRTKNKINQLLVLLKIEKKPNLLAVIAANGIGMLDDLTLNEYAMQQSHHKKPPSGSAINIHW